MYAALRLLFVFADTGAAADRRTASPAGRGPTARYQRYVADGRAAELASYGVTDGPPSLLPIREQAQGAGLIVTLCWRFPGRRRHPLPARAVTQGLTRAGVGPPRPDVPFEPGVAWITRGVARRSRV